MKHALVLGAALFAFAGSAVAQEASKFEGAKVGVLAGYDNFRVKEQELGSGSKDGFLYGITAGYDYSLGSVIIGAEAELSGTTIKESDEEFKGSLGRDLYVGARIGAPVSDNVMLYAKAGYTNARLSLKADLGDDLGRLKYSQNFDGYRLGAGVEYAMDKAFARLEYRFSDYGNLQVFGLETGLSSKRHQVAVSGGFRF